MKVRNRYGGPEFEVVEWLIVKDKQGMFHIVEKAAFEEIPSEPHWVDVTGQCNVFENKIDLHTYLHPQHNGMCITKDNGYRLRKVRVCTPASLSQAVVEHWAFIVERKVID